MRHAYSNPVADTYNNTEPRCVYSNSDPNSKSDCNSDTDTDCNSDSDSDSNGYSYSYSGCLGVALRRDDLHEFWRNHHSRNWNWRDHWRPG